VTRTDDIIHRSTKANLHLSRATKLRKAENFLNNYIFDVISSNC